MKKLVFTNHAKKRIKEQQFSSDIILKAFEEAKRVKIPQRRKMYKYLKYPNSQEDIEYYYAKGVLYTVNKKDDYYVLITITRKNKKELKFIK